MESNRPALPCLPDCLTACLLICSLASRAGPARRSAPWDSDSYAKARSHARLSRPSFPFHLLPGTCIWCVRRPGVQDPDARQACVGGQNSSERVRSTASDRFSSVSGDSPLQGAHERRVYRCGNVVGNTPCTRKHRVACPSRERRRTSLGITFETHGTFSVLHDSVEPTISIASYREPFPISSLG